MKEILEIQELPKEIVNLNSPFKISAGPGAGKTTWLVRHIQNVIKRSDKLDKTKKVACITYTRVGADTIRKRIKIETGTNRLDVGTIHSFLYRNVVKPFSFLIEKDMNGENLFNVNELNGHTDHIPSYSRIQSWIYEIGSKKYGYLCNNDESIIGKTNFDKTISILYDCDWRFKGDDLKYVPKSFFSKDFKFPSTKLFEYKHAYWHKGIMHHEDVLYFTHYIFKNYPKVIEFVSNKFPYLFVDEFQDTNPIQTWIIKQLSLNGAVIGVIGDPAQSIFKFAGTSRKDFNDFYLPNLVCYKKTTNFRSTERIIDFLKILRDDIEQKPAEDAKKGEPVLIKIGEDSDSIKYIKDLGDDYAVLCRYNKEVNQLISDTDGCKYNNLISTLYSVDSNYERLRFIHSLFITYDCVEHEEYKEAVKEINKHLRTAKMDGIEKRKIAIKIITYLQKNSDLKIVEIYNHIICELKKYDIKFAKIIKTKGEYKEIYLHNFEDFLPFLAKQTKNTCKIRTIHQAKGEEFKNVLICLFDKTDSNGVIKKTLKDILRDYVFNSQQNIKIDNEIGEETRLFYVACSRARERLIINVPTLSEEDEKKMKKLGLRIKRD